jgi:hypothetical protein
MHTRVCAGARGPRPIGVGWLPPPPSAIDATGNFRARLCRIRANLEVPRGTIASVAEPQTISLDEQLKEIGAQLAWVRDYL